MIVFKPAVTLPPFSILQPSLTGSLAYVFSPLNNRHTASSSHLPIYPLTYLSTYIHYCICTLFYLIFNFCPLILPYAFATHVFGLPFVCVCKFPFTSLLCRRCSMIEYPLRVGAALFPKPTNFLSPHSRLSVHAGVRARSGGPGELHRCMTAPKITFLILFLFPFWSRFGLVLRAAMNFADFQANIIVLSKEHPL